MNIGAIEQLHRFIEDGLSKYKTRQRLSFSNHTSHLSPYLAWGEMSPKTIWHTILNLKQDEQVEAFLRQLVWREFSYHQLIHVPE